MDLDMSANCGQKFFEFWEAANIKHTMTHEDFTTWFNANCFQCKYMCEICLIGVVDE